MTHTGDSASAEITEEERVQALWELTGRFFPTTSHPDYDLEINCYVDNTPVREEITIEDGKGSYLSTSYDVDDSFLRMVVTLEDGWGRHYMTNWEKAGYPDGIDLEEYAGGDFYELDREEVVARQHGIARAFNQDLHDEIQHHVLGVADADIYGELFSEFVNFAVAEGDPRLSLTRQFVESHFDVEFEFGSPHYIEGEDVVTNWEERQ